MSREHTGRPPAHKLTGAQRYVDLEHRSFRVSNRGVPTPTLDYGVANKKYVDDILTVHETATNAPTGFPNRADSTLSISTRTFTIAPSGSSFVYYIAGVVYTVSASDDIIIEDTSGVHYIYYDGSTLSESVNPSHATIEDIMENKAWVGTVYWNATDGAAYILGDERHGAIMSGKTHHWLHDINGSAYGSGLTLSGYTEDTASNAALTFELTDGRFYDEDLEHDISDGTPANQYEQQLNGGDAEIPILYRDDIDGSWKEDAASTLPYKTGGTGRLAYNKDDGDGTFSQMEVTDNKFVSATLIATNDWLYPIKMIQGQNDYTDKKTAVESATNEILNLGNLPSPEMIVLYRLVMQTKDTFGGTKKSKIVGVTDFRGSVITGATAIAIAHGASSGLANDDHAQYLLVDGTRAMTAALNMGTQKITAVVDPTANQEAATKKYVDDQMAVPGAHDLGGASHNADTLANLSGKVSDDTVCGIAATQVLTNKTLTSPTINGTIAPTGLTMPAFTLGGAVTLNGQSFDAGATSAIINTTGVLVGLIVNGSNSGHGPSLYLKHTHTTPDLNSIIGDINVYGYDGNASPATLRYGLIRIRASNVTDTSEEGSLDIYLAAGGAADNQVLRMTGPGVLDIDASSGLGPAVVGQFDDWPDLVAVDNAIKNQDFRLLEEMKVFTKKDTGSGYMMNVQAATHLSWCLSRQIYNELKAENDKLKQRLGKLELALTQGG